MRGTRLALLLLLAAGCGPRPEGRSPEPVPAKPLAALVNRVWVRDDSTAVRGTLRIFLEDGTLLMGSCGEPYRLARWRPEGDRAVSWQEETVTIRADLLHLAPDSLALRLALVHGEEVEGFRPAAVPFVCPDLPR